MIIHGFSFKESSLVYMKSRYCCFIYNYLSIYKTVLLLQIGWQTLQEEFRFILEKSKSSKDHDDIFDNLKSSVVDDAIRNHSWESKAVDMLVSSLFCMYFQLALISFMTYLNMVFNLLILKLLIFLYNFQRIIQLNALEDRAVSDKQQWDNAIKFLESSLKDRLSQSKTDFIPL